MGDSALEAVLEARSQGGAFKDLFDFAERIDAKRVNRGVLEALIAGGAFDATLLPRKISRARAFAAVDRALERARNASRDRERGQTSLFAMFAAAEPPSATVASEYPEAAPWDLKETLLREKEALGFYVSGHPLDRYGIELSRFEVSKASAIAAMSNWSRVKVCGMVEEYNCRIFKGGGGKVARFKLEDPTGRVDVKVREKQIDQFEEILQSKEPVLVSGKVSFPMTDDEDENAAPREPTLMLDDVVPLGTMLREQAKWVHVRLREARHGVDGASRLSEVFAGSPGTCPIQITVELEGGSEVSLAVPGVRVEPNDALFSGVEKLFGSRVLELR